MKVFKSYLAFFAIMMLLIASCKKNVDQKAVAVKAGDQADNVTACYNCVMTNTQEDLLGESWDFHYDANGRLQSLNDSSVQLKYDKWNRLIKVSFGDYAG